MQYNLLGNLSSGWPEGEGEADIGDVIIVPSISYFASVVQSQLVFITHELNMSISKSNFILRNSWTC